MESNSRIAWNVLVQDLAAMTSMTSLAKRLGTSQKQVSRWITGQVKPQDRYAELLRAACAVYGITWQRYCGRGAQTGGA
jgi:transcriptional regulator with XRE-family HTH domain